jgi:hypothetical protein
MKKLLFNSIPIAFIALMAAGVLLGGQGHVRGKAPVKTFAKTYVNSQVDTIFYSTVGNEASLAFAIHLKDSAKITHIRLLRYFNGKSRGFATADTLLGGAGFASIFEDTVAVYSITLAPLAAVYATVITYTSSGNGVTTPTVTYGYTVTEGK